MTCAGAGGAASVTGFFGGISCCGAPAGAADAVPAGGNGGNTLCDSGSDPSGGIGGNTLWDSRTDPSDGNGGRSGGGRSGIQSSQPPLAHGFQTQQAAFAESGTTASIDVMETVKSNRAFMNPSPLPSASVRNTAWRQGPVALDRDVEFGVRPAYDKKGADRSRPSDPLWALDFMGAGLSSPAAVSWRGRVQPAGSRQSSVSFLTLLTARLTA